MTKLHSKNNSVEWDEVSKEPLWGAVQKLSGVFTHVTTDNMEVVIKMMKAEFMKNQNDPSLHLTTYGVIRIEQV